MIWHNFQKTEHNDLSYVLSYINTTEIKHFLFKPRVKTYAVIGITLKNALEKEFENRENAQ